MSVEEKLAAKYTNPSIQTSPELKMTEKANGRLEVGERGGFRDKGKLLVKSVTPSALSQAKYLESLFRSSVAAT